MLASKIFTGDIFKEPHINVPNKLGNTDHVYLKSSCPPVESFGSNSRNKVQLEAKATSLTD